MTLRESYEALKSEENLSPKTCELIEAALEEIDKADAIFDSDGDK